MFFILIHTAVSACSDVSFIFSFRAVCSSITHFPNWNAMPWSRAGPLSWVAFMATTFCGKEKQEQWRAYFKYKNFFPNSFQNKIYPLIPSFCFLHTSGKDYKHYLYLLVMLLCSNYNANDTGVENILIPLVFCFVRNTNTI